jgi:hypothetical protein
VIEEKDNYRKDTSLNLVSFFLPSLTVPISGRLDQAKPFSAGTEYGHSHKM